MDERKKELRDLIVDVVNRFFHIERVDFSDRVRTLRPIEDIMQYPDKDRDRYMEIRKEITGLVSEFIHREFEYSDEAKKRWQKEVFGSMPEMELSLFLEETYATISEEYRKILELKREMNRSRRT